MADCEYGFWEPEHPPGVPIETRGWEYFECEEGGVRVLAMVETGVLVLQSADGDYPIIARRSWGPLFAVVYDAIIRYNGPREGLHLAKLARQAWIEGRRRARRECGGRKWGVQRPKWSAFDG